MVFSSSFPIYLDHQQNPTNWTQLLQSNPSNHQGSGGIQNSQQLELPLPLPPQLGGPGGGGGGPTRLGSMVDRARIAKVPQPEAGLKCPRCDSTNTKFCYFNNYSLTQPRHFCKTCRRYWTRGGALRNVPVGGGCRRNKRSKNNIASNNISKSQVDHNQTGPNKSTNGSPSSCSTDMSTHFTQLTSQLPFLPTLQSLSQYNIAGNIGTNNTASFQPQGFHNTGTGNNGILPFLANFEAPTNLFPYQNGSSGQGSQVKTEENPGLDLSRQFMGVNSENNQYWAGINTNTWTTAYQYSGINSSSTTNLV